MVPILITANRRKAGKFFFTIGLAQNLTQQGYTVGYIKPLGNLPVQHGHDIYDEDAVFAKEALGLADPLAVISPFVLSYNAQNQLLEGGLGDVKEHILSAFNTLKDRDFVLVHGATDIFDGISFGIDAPALAQETSARVLMVEAWRGDISIDTILGAKKLFGRQFIGGIITQVSDGLLRHVNERVKPFFERRGVTIGGIFPKDSILEAIKVRHIVEMLNGRVLCCEEGLDDYVENFSIGAMDVDSALSYFRKVPNKAVITGAHRTDIQFVAMETSTKCIILTGGMQTSDVVVSKAQSKGIPIISVETDTFTTVDRMERRIDHTMIRERRKVERAREIVSSAFDIGEFLKSASRADK